MKTLKLLMLALCGLVVPLTAAPLPNPAVITTDADYDLSGLQRGKNYALVIHGTLDTAIVRLQYQNPANNSWDQIAYFNSASPPPTAGFVHTALNSTQRLSITGCSGLTYLTVQAFPCDPVPPTGVAGLSNWSAVSVQGVTNGTPVPVSGTLTGSGGGPVTVQDTDAVMQTDTLASLNATSVVKDCTGYKSVTIQVTAVGVGGATAPEVSNDGVNWLAVTGYQTNNIGTTAPTLSFTPGVGVTVVYPTPAKFFRIRQASWTSGSFTYVSSFRSAPIPLLGVYLAQSGNAAVGIQGTVANGANVTGNPVRIGGRTRTALALLTAADQTVDLVASSCGQLITKPYAPAESDWSYVPPANGIISSSTQVVAKAAAGAGLRNLITSMTITSEPQSSVTEFVIEDGSTPIFRIRIGTAGLPNGLDINFPTPLKGTANTALGIRSTITTNGAILCNLQGYTAP